MYRYYLCDISLKGRGMCWMTQFWSMLLSAIIMLFVNRSEVGIIMNISHRLIISLSLFAASAIGECSSSASFIVPRRTSHLSRTPNNIPTRLFGRRGGGGGGKKKEQKFTKSNLPEKTCVVCGRPFAWRKKWSRCWDEVTCCSKSCNAQRRSASKEA